MNRSLPLLPLGYLLSALAMTDWLLARWAEREEPPSWLRRALALLSVLLLIRAVMLVPVIGPLVPFVLSRRPERPSCRYLASRQLRAHVAQTATARETP